MSRRIKSINLTSFFNTFFGRTYHKQRLKKKKKIGEDIYIYVHTYTYVYLSYLCACTCIYVCTEKGSVSRIYKELSQIHLKIVTLLQKWEEVWTSNPQRVQAMHIWKVTQYHWPSKKCKENNHHIKVAKLPKAPSSKRRGGHGKQITHCWWKLEVAHSHQRVFVLRANLKTCIP